MDPSFYVNAVLMQWVVQSPALVVYFLGAVVALTCWGSHRLAAVLTLCAMVLLGVLTLGMPILFLGLPLWQSEHAWSMKQVGFFSSAISLISSVGHAVSIGLLLAAVFLRRSVPGVNAPSNPPASLPPL